MKQKIIDFFKHNEKFELAEDFVYINKQTKLLLTCRKCGAKTAKRWVIAMQNYGCPKCTSNAPTPFSKVLDLIHSKNYKYVSGDHKNNLSELVIKCDKGHIFSTTTKSLILYNCPTCAGNKKKSLEEVINFASFKGFTFISGDYKNARSKLTFKCQNDHVFTTNWVNISKYGCQFCAGKLTDDQYKSRLLKAGLEEIAPETFKCFKHGHVFNYARKAVVGLKSCMICKSFNFEAQKLAISLNFKILKPQFLGGSK